MPRKKERPPCHNLDPQKMRAAAKYYFSKYDPVKKRVPRSEVTETCKKGECSRQALRKRLKGLRSFDEYVAAWPETRHRGSKTTLAREVERALAWVCIEQWKRNRCLNIDMLLVLAREAAKMHGCVWKASSPSLPGGAPQRVRLGRAGVRCAPTCICALWATRGGPSGARRVAGEHGPAAHNG